MNVSLEDGLFELLEVDVSVLILIAQLEYLLQTLFVYAVDGTVVEQGFEFVLVDHSVSILIQQFEKLFQVLRPE